MTHTVLSRRNINWLPAILLLGLLALGLIIPALGLPQSITGPLVNALLILSVETVGVGGAVLVGLTTPLSAVTHGVLPLPLMVMLPFISVGNALLVTLYGALRERKPLLAVIVAALGKFAWLYAVVTWLTARPLSLNVAGAPISAEIPATLAQMMEWPQLATALAGGALALALLRGASGRTKRGN